MRKCGKLLSRITQIFNPFAHAGVNRPNSDGETRLFIAVKDGDLRRAQKLLDKGADPNIMTTHGMTPLHIAAYWGDVSLVKLLLKNNADPNMHKGFGWTPVHSAAIAGGIRARGEIIALLKARGGKTDIKDKHGWTAGDYMQLWEKNENAAAKLKEIMSAQACAATGVAGQHCSHCGPRAPRH